MTDVIPVLLLLVVFTAGLLLVPLGLPGLWVMVLGVIGYGWWTGFRDVGLVTIVVALGLALAAELLEMWLGFRYAKRYGGSQRAGWGALIGGIIGAIVGVPIPIVGSVIGAFVGAFAGAAVMQYTLARTLDGAVVAGWGAVLGRAASVAVKTGVGVVIVVVTVFAMVRA